MGNKKAAELPMNFIVIAAIAILVLILVAMFFLGGFRTQAFDSQTAANICASKCFTKQRAAVSENKPNPASTFAWDYCTNVDVKGMGTVNCTVLSPCTLSYADGDCKVSCPSNGNAKCS